MCGLFGAAAGVASAQSDDPGVAYVSALNGTVSVQRGDSGDVESAGLNAPLMVGDYVLTGPNGRAEVQFDYGHFARVGPDAQLRFDELDPSADSVQLAAGSLGLAVIHSNGRVTRVETPSVTVQPREAGMYRIAVESNGTTEITVRSGDASVLLPQGARSLHSGSTMYVWGPAGSPSFRYVRPVGYDSFDAWNNDRDASFERSNAYRYTPDFIPGAYALDSYGQWANDPQYGNEWIPSDVASDWSPYSSGQWTDEPYYGWTWVDNDPWGYAPFHYGRWHHDRRRNRWAWTPGPRDESAQGWSPALVAFIGFGGGVTIALTDNIGWVPLGPSEQPHPWWGSGARGYSAANVSNFRGSYANASYPNAVRSLPRQSFGNGSYTRIAPVAAANLTHVVAMRAALPVVPGPQSLRYTQHAAAATRRPSAQAFHAFATTPRAPQTFAQQRTTAAVVAQRAAPAAPRRTAARPQQRPATATRPQIAPQRAPVAVHAPRAQPVAQQPRVQTPRAAPVVQAPRQAPVLRAPRPAPVAQAPRQLPVMQAPPRQAPVLQAPRQAPVALAPRQAPAPRAAAPVAAAAKPGAEHLHAP